MSNHSLIRSAKARHRLCHTILIVCCLSLHPAAAVAADTITGTVRNETSGQPAGGDEVVLLRLGEGMQEEARTKTDAQGAFTLNVSEAKAPYVVRVFHQGVNYDQSVTGSKPLEIRVFDAVAKIPGMSGNIGIAQMESSGKALKVTEMYAVTNSSAPPVTQSGANSFVISVPAKASLDALEVRSESGIWVKVAPAPVTGQKNLYAVNFPLRPGNTFYKFAYHLPYEGPTTLHLKLAFPIKNFAVMVPPSMSFKASHPDTFKAPGLANGFVVNAAKDPIAREVPAFVVSGAGAAPPPPAESNTMPPPRVSAPPTAEAGNLRGAPPAQGQSPNQSSDQSKKEFWPILSGIVVLLAAGVFSIWRMRRNVVRATAPNEKAGSKEPLLDALKEELFQLESDRLHGSISAEEYEATKAALNQNLQRAMERK
ncbi:MAG TPA: carboxypeptidase regulatory-like domain-containing protein [Candidatus Solibacter sp.]|nr:carboxypeptidase regulatory-like domain-containing protein [Candidatus Solibacter sp.]